MRPILDTTWRVDETLQVEHSAFVDAGRSRGIDDSELDELWTAIDRHLEEAAARPGVGLRHSRLHLADERMSERFVRVMLGVGGLLVLGSFGWWATSYGDWPFWRLIAFAATFGAIALAGAVVASRRGLDDLTALLATIVAFLVPLVAYASLEKAGFDFAFSTYGDFYEWIDGGWVWLELAAIVGALVLWLGFRQPLLMLPLALFTYFAAMDVTARVVGAGFESSRTIGTVLLLYAGVTLLVATTADLLGLRRHAVWLHAFGAIGVLGGLGFYFLEDIGVESYGRALIATSVGLFVLGAWLGRVVHLVFGGLALVAGVSMVVSTALALTVVGSALVVTATLFSLRPTSLTSTLARHRPPAPQRD